MTDWDNYLGANDKPFVENLNDALLLANVFNLTVPIELPTMFNTGAWDLTTNAKQKAGVAVIQTLDATGISNGSNNTLTGTGTLKFAFYPNFNQYGGITKVEWTADSGTITVDIYDSTGTVIKSNIPNGDIGTVGSTIRDLQNFEFRVHFNNATLTDFKVTMTNNDETRYGAEVGIDDVNGLDERLDNIEANINAIADVIYPVGSIYMSMNSADPSTLFGGTWTQLEDRFLLAAKSTDETTGVTGGEKSVTLTTTQMPSHTHIQNSHNHTQNSHSHAASNNQYFITSDKSLQTGSTKRVAPANNQGNHYVQSPDGEPTIERTSNTKTATATNQSATATNQNTGGGQAHNNMPPYLTVNMWQRTA